MINDEIDKLRHAATTSLLTRKDVIIVASVSCIYGLGSPEAYQREVLHIRVNDRLDRAEFLRKLIGMQYERTTADLTRGHFRANGDVIEVMPPSDETVFRIIIEGSAVREIFSLNKVTRKVISHNEDAWFFPAKHFMSDSAERERAIRDIEFELAERLKDYDKEGKLLEVERLTRRTRYDIGMIRNIGYCSGIENYSRHFDGRKVGEPAHTLLSYFPKDFLTIIDESHVTLPQIGGMFAGDQARKQTLVDFGFRLPSAKDNRPLTYQEFDKTIGQTVYVSATPGVVEKETSERIVEQIIRPTGLVDPETLVLPVTENGKWKMENGKTVHYPGQVADIIVRIEERVAKGERALVTTLTKKMAEDLAGYLKEKKMKVAYLHSDVETLDRITILSDLRRGLYDVLVGVNLLREGLDLPEVSLIGILDADKEGFLRSETSLIQTIGRAARNINGLVVLYADHMTGSLNRALEETARRRKIQIAHNKEHGITPVTITKVIRDIRAELEREGSKDTSKILNIEISATAKEIEEVIAEKEIEMDKASANLLFETAAILRDEIALLRQELSEKGGKKGKGKRRIKK
jgi:excinuclease ABC subunit B